MKLVSSSEATPPSCLLSSETYGGKEPASLQVWEVWLLRLSRIECRPDGGLRLLWQPDSGQSDTILSPEQAEQFGELLCRKQAEARQHVVLKKAREYLFC